MNELLRKILFLPPQASSVARSVDHLHYFVILTTMGGATLVTIVGGVFLLRFRSNRLPHEEAKPRAPQFHTPLWLEFSVIGFLLALFFAFWVLGLRVYTRLRVAPEGALQIYVTAKQWMWKFAYPNGEHTISTLYVPIGRAVELDMTSRDVIHSFYVPDFRIKQDIIPGRYTTVWFTAQQAGPHEIFCTQYCGVGHSSMRGEVIALAPAEYERWLEGMASARPAGEVYDEPGVVTQYAVPHEVDLLREGELAAATRGCLRCHTTDGTPHLGPTWAGLYHSMVPLADGTSVYADEAYLTESMMDPMAKIHAGFLPIMPTYQGILEPAEVGAIIALIKSLRAVPIQPRGGPPDVAPAALPTGPDLEPGAMGQPQSQPTGPLATAPGTAVPSPVPQVIAPPPAVEPPAIPATQRASRLLPGSPASAPSIIPARRPARPTGQGAKP